MARIAEIEKITTTGGLKFWRFQAGFSEAEALQVMQVLADKASPNVAQNWNQRDNKFYKRTTLCVEFASHRRAVLEYLHKLLNRHSYHGV